MHITYLGHLVVQENQHQHLDLVAQETLVDQRDQGLQENQQTQQHHAVPLDQVLQEIHWNQGSP